MARIACAPQHRVDTLGVRSASCGLVGQFRSSFGAILLQPSTCRINQAVPARGCPSQQEQARRPASFSIAPLQHFLYCPVHGAAFFVSQRVIQAIYAG